MTTYRHATYAITRAPLGLPCGTLAPEHIATVAGPASAWRTLHAYGCEPEIAGFVAGLAALRVGENITCQSADFRYSVEREPDTCGRRAGAYVCHSCGTDEAMPGHEC